MIAYVDANGVIVDEPPTSTPKDEIAIEDIEVSIPRKEEVEETGEPIGRVDFYDESRGFGFIKEKDSVNKYFFTRAMPNRVFRKTIWLLSGWNEVPRE